MDAPTPARLLSIGEFAAATQLSPKALRLYDDHRLLAPAKIDAGNGYRYYGNDQVHLGRLIRTLRDMDLSLQEVASVISLEGVHAEMRMTQLTRERDRRYAREKQAFQAALLLLQRPSRSEPPEIHETRRPEMTVAVRSFMSDRHAFFGRYSLEVAALRATLGQAGLNSSGMVFASLIDPLSDEEGRVEVVIQIEAPVQMPCGVCLRQMPFASCAAVSLDQRSIDAVQLTAALDTLFDWFDRRGRRAADPPLVCIEPRSSGLQVEIQWAYESI